MTADDDAPSPRARRLWTALGILVLAGAIFLEQWCHYKSLPHPAPLPPMAGSNGSG
jgi:hypothetical protein